MKNLLLSVLTLAAAVLLPLQSTSAAEKLGDLLRDSGWDRIVGTWVDAETGGDRVQLTYAWKIEGRVLEATVKAGERTSVALIGVKASTGEVFHVGADSEGSAFLGTWRAEGGDAILDLRVDRANGEDGSMEVRHHFQDDDTLRIALGGDSPVEIRMARKKD